MKVLIGCLLIATAVLAVEDGEKWSEPFVIELPKPARVANDFDERSSFGHTALLNNYIDDVTASISQFMKDNSLDPMVLPDLIEGIEFKPLLITYSARVSLTQGTATGLSKLSRASDNYVNYFAKMLRIRVAMRLSDIDFSYRYATQVMNLGPTGRISGSLQYIDTVVDILIDFNNDEIHLQTFAFEDYGNLTIRLSGNILTDWFVNPFINLFTRILQDTVFGTVEAVIRATINEAIAAVNMGIKEVLGNL